MKDDQIIGIIVRKGRKPEQVLLDISPAEETIDQLAREMDELFRKNPLNLYTRYDDQNERSKTYRKDLAAAAWFLGARPANMPPVPNNKSLSEETK